MICVAARAAEVVQLEREERAAEGSASEDPPSDLARPDEPRELPRADEMVQPDVVMRAQFAALYRKTRTALRL